MSTTWQLPDASIVLPSACAAFTNGNFAVSGGAIDSSGHPATFILFLDPSGKTTEIRQLSNLAVSRITFDSKGNLWAIGCVPGYQIKKGDPQDILVRGFDPNGSLLQSIDIPYSFDPGLHWRPVVGSFLSSSEKQLVILTPQRNDLILISLTDGSSQVRHFQTPSSSIKLVSGFGVSKGGGIYMSAIQVSPTNPHSEQAVFYRWDDGPATWKQIELDYAGGKKLHSLLGVDGDRFLAMRGPTELVWSKIPAS